MWEKSDLFFTRVTLWLLSTFFSFLAVARPVLHSRTHFKNTYENTDNVLSKLVKYAKIWPWSHKKGIFLYPLQWPSPLSHSPNCSAWTWLCVVFLWWGILVDFYICFVFFTTWSEFLWSSVYCFWCSAVAQPLVGAPSPTRSWFTLIF